MKITAQEEYGLRILIRIGRCRDKEGMSIPQLAEAEGLSSHYVAKLTRMLRMKGFINSTPGYKGGYVLAISPREIVINNVLKALGGASVQQYLLRFSQWYDEDMYQFCRLFSAFTLANDPIYRRPIARPGHTL